MHRSWRRRWRRACDRRRRGDSRGGRVGSDGASRAVATHPEDRGRDHDEHGDGNQLPRRPGRRAAEILLARCPDVLRAWELEMREFFVHLGWYFFAWHFFGWHLYRSLHVDCRLWW